MIQNQWWVKLMMPLTWIKAEAPDFILCWHAVTVNKIVSFKNVFNKTIKLVNFKNHNLWVRATSSFYVKKNKGMHKAFLLYIKCAGIMVSRKSTYELATLHETLFFTWLNDWRQTIQNQVWLTLLEKEEVSLSLHGK